MYFKDKRVAQLNLHQESVLSNCAVISGDKGNIEVSGMNCKFQDKLISRLIQAHLSYFEIVLPIHFDSDYLYQFLFKLVSCCI